MQSCFACKTVFIYRAGQKLAKSVAVYVVIGGYTDMDKSYANDVQAYYCPEQANCSGKKNNNQYSIIVD
jgi:hypothetical protein